MSVHDVTDADVMAALTRLSTPGDRRAVQTAFEILVEEMPHVSEDKLVILITALPGLLDESTLVPLGREQLAGAAFAMGFRLARELEKSTHGAALP